MSRLAATANGPVIEAPGEQLLGGTGGAFQPRTRGDWALVQRAAQQGWNAPPATRQAICEAIGPALHDASDRQALAIVRAMLAIEAANLPASRRLRACS